VSDFDLIWARIVRISSFVGGMAIMGYETIADHSDRPWLYAASLGMMGLPVARAAENLLSKFANSSQPNEEPPASTRNVVEP